MKHMPDRPETWAWLAAWLEANFPAIYAGALAMLIAVWRIIYSGGKLRQLALEAPLCGLLGIGVSYGPALIGAPQQAGVFLACMVGLFGVEASRAAAKKVIIKKADQL
ncbi:phage holin, lambda family [Stutzerimonas zhaodongensis]|nr:phage holin, lambda family [Stutzerimonas zhaodongensis]MCQ4314486.1 phage holin, lambda family [Stutzerimonas zhaodongensis]